LLGKIRAFSPLLKLKANQEFVWGKEQQLALDEMKNYLINPLGSTTTRKTLQIIFVYR